MTTPSFPIYYSHSANLLFSTRFNVTIENPDSFAGSQAWRHISGTDPDTGFSYTDLAGAPLYVKPSLGGGLIGSGGYGLLYINQASVPAYPTNNLAGVENKCQTLISDKKIRGSALKELSATWQDTGSGAGYQTQVWLTLQRYLQAESLATDLKTFCMRKWITIPDQSALLSSTTSGQRYNYFTDVKTGTVTPGGGDGRYAHGLIMSQANLFGGAYDEIDVPAGTIGWIAQGDSNANRPGYGTSFPAETFFRMKNFTVPVPVNEPFQLETYWKRSKSYNDLETGRFRIVMRKLDGTEYVLFDVNKKSVAEWNAANPLMPPAVNRHMGYFGDVIHRIFVHGIYFGGKPNQTAGMKIHALDIYDDIPYYLPEVA
jgi:hypothetical protein